jgi:multiple sugar transport system substrate-binding protein
MLIDRRRALKYGALALASGTLPLGCSKPAEAAIPLRCMSHPGQILPILTHQMDYLKSNYGITLKILESPDPTSYLDAVKDREAGGGRYDIVMFFPRFNGELAPGYLRPLDDLIEKHAARDLFTNIVDAYRILYSRWGGKTIAVPVDGDVAMLYYRKDAFLNPDYQKKYRDRHGSELRVPRTWEEFRKVAQFFTGWAWGPSGRPGYGFQTSTWERAYIEQQWAPMMASAGGNWFTKDLKPAWNNEAGIRALRDLKGLLDFAPPGSISLSWNHTMENIFTEDVAMVLWYMDLGRLGMSPHSWFAKNGGPAKMKLFGYALWPGYESGGVYRNFNSMFYGRVVGISRFSKNPEAAFQVLRTLLVPERRVLSMDDDQSGSDMFLKTDYDPAVFKKLSPPRDFLETARKVLENGFPEMQLPGAGEYMDALQGSLHAYLTGSESDPAAALRSAADRWEAITDRLGRAKQAGYWAEVSGRYKEAGLRIAEL